MKPTYGTVSRYGLIAYASSLDQIGPLARTAADCAAVLDLPFRAGTSGTAPVWTSTPDSLLERPERRSDGHEDRHSGWTASARAWIPTCGEKVLAVAEVLKGRGAQVEECTLPIMEYVVPTYYIIAAAEASSNLSRFDGVKYGWRAGDYEDLTDLYCKHPHRGLWPRRCKRRILLGTFVLSSGYYDAYYKKALQVKAVIKQAFDEAFRKYDLLLTPVVPTTAPKLGESLSDPLQMYLSDIYTVSVNLAGLPAISVPCGFDRKGMPMGAQLIGAPLMEQKVLNAAHAFQQDTDYHTKRPRSKGGEVT